MRKNKLRVQIIAIEQQFFESLCVSTSYDSTNFWKEERGTLVTGVEPSTSRLVKRKERVAHSEHVTPCMVATTSIQWVPELVAVTFYDQPTNSRLN